jgi:hypothetical protein
MMKSLFVLENEAREVISIFYNDPRVTDLAKRQLTRQFGAVGTVATVYAESAEMRRHVLQAAAPLELNMQLTILDSLAARAAEDDDCRALISGARHEQTGEVAVGASIKLAQSNRETSQINATYLTETQEDLEAIGPRMDQRRQGALGALTVIRRFDLIPKDDGSGLRGIGFHKFREMLRFVTSEWHSIAEGVGDDDTALGRLGILRNDFFEVFANDLNASAAMSRFALRLIENPSNGAPAAAISLAERHRPRSGFLRELCLRSLNYNGGTNWDSYSTALTAGDTLGRNFSGETVLEDQLLTTVNANLFDPGAIMAVCEGWSRSDRFVALRAVFKPTGHTAPVFLRLATVLSDPERFVEALRYASDNLHGDLWESPSHWVPAVIRRIKDDDDAYRRMRDILFGEPSPGIKASFPRLMARARALESDLRDWCRLKCGKNVTVGEVGMDLIAGKVRLVSQSLFDSLIYRDDMPSPRRLNFWQPLIIIHRSTHTIPELKSLPTCQLTSEQNRNILRARQYGTGSMLLAPQSNPKSDDPLESAADQVIAACDGDVRAAVRALIVANGMLEAELNDVRTATSKGYARGRKRSEQR